MATREEKVRKKQERSLRRIKKRQAKDSQIKAIYGSDRSMSQARKISQGRGIRCEMGWASCEERGYCNGDC